MSDGLFLCFSRDTRPLSRELQRRYLDPLLREVGLMRPDDFERSDEEIVAAALASVDARPPSLLGMEFASSRDRDGDWRPGPSEETRVSTTRHYVAVEVEGELDLLEFWPDISHGLRPIDDSELDVWGVDWFPSPYDESEAARRHEMRLERARWTIAFRQHEGQLRALYTFVDLTDEEEHLVAENEFDVGNRVLAIRAGIEPIVLAIADQTERFVDGPLPAQLIEAVTRRRRQVNARKAVQRSLEFEVGWSPTVPTVVEVPAADSAPHEQIDVKLPLVVRFSERSFEDVQLIVRQWADSAERYPETFRQLGEDRLSDLLAATLNTHVPSGREVYSRGGKTDIFVTASWFDVGYAPEKVFIIEAKIWHGQAKAVEALDQLLGYLKARETAAILLFYVREKDGQSVRLRCLEALRAHACFSQELDATVEDWPVLRFATDIGRAEIAICFVDLPTRPGA